MSYSSAVDSHTSVPSWLTDRLHFPMGTSACHTTSFYAFFPTSQLVSSWFYLGAGFECLSCSSPSCLATPYGTLLSDGQLTVCLFWSKSDRLVVPNLSNNSPKAWVVDRSVRFLVRLAVGLQVHATWRPYRETIDFVRVDSDCRFALPCTLTNDFLSFRCFAFVQPEYRFMGSWTSMVEWRNFVYWIFDSFYYLRRIVMWVKNILFCSVLVFSCALERVQELGPKNMWLWSSGNPGVGLFENQERCGTDDNLHRGNNDPVSCSVRWWVVHQVPVIWFWRFLCTKYPAFSCFLTVVWAFPNPRFLFLFHGSARDL